MTNAPAASPTPTPTTWTTRTLLEWISGTLAEREVESPRRMAELLLAHVIGCDRLRLYMENDRAATDEERATLRDLVKRAMAHEPIQYLVGKETFYGLEFATDRRALIPRPSSRTIIDELLRVFPAPKKASLLDSIAPEEPNDAEQAPVIELHADLQPSESADAQTEHAAQAGPATLHLADIGTGTGCLAITAAVRLPHAQVRATDLSADALELAATNAESHQVTSRVQFHQGDLLAALPADTPPLHAIVSNPPYIPDHEWDAVAPNVKNHEPHSALRAADNGLQFVNPLIDHAPERLAAGGLLLIELAACTAKEALARAQANPMLTECTILRDEDGLDRVLSARRLAE